MPDVSPILRSLICGSLLLLMLSSCSTERRLAREYLKNHKGEGIMLSPADFLYKENLGALMDTVTFPTPDQQDSVAFYSSIYVQYISDSILLTRFTNGLIDELSAYGYQLILDQAADKFLAMNKPAWIVQLAQIQMEEDNYPGYVYAFDDDDQAFEQAYQVNLIGLNTWTEVSPVNQGSNTGVRQLLFLSGYIDDDSPGAVSLEYYRGSFYLNDYRNILTFQDIYKMADELGRKHAELLFDYFLNDYIRRNMPAGHAKRKELHYNKQFGILEEGLLERFEVIR
jgi:hypothetical protein